MKKCCEKSAIRYVYKISYEKDCPWHPENGKTSLQCLKAAFSKSQGKIEWYPETTRYAAENGHLDCLKYTIEHGCPWDPAITINAAANGNLDCLKYVVEHG